LTKEAIGNKAGHQSSQHVFQSTDDGSSKLTRSPVNKKGLSGGGAFGGGQQDNSFRFSTGNNTFDERDESLISASQIKGRNDAKTLDDILSESDSNESTHRHRSP
jgi:hypothetical protein